MTKKCLSTCFGFRLVDWWVVRRGWWEQKKLFHAITLFFCLDFSTKLELKRNNRQNANTIFNLKISHFTLIYMFSRLFFSRNENDFWLKWHCQKCLFPCNLSSNFVHLYILDEQKKKRKNKKRNFATEFARRMDWTTTMPLYLWSASLFSTCYLPWMKDRKYSISLERFTLVLFFIF